MSDVKKGSRVVWHPNTKGTLGRVIEVKDGYVTVKWENQMTVEPQCIPVDWVRPA